MHLEQSNFLPCNRFKLSIVIALIVAQPILFSYLLALDVSATLLLTLLCGIPIALGSSFLLTREVNHCYARMSIVMFAAGGFGMLLGYVVDLNQMGLYALLSHHGLTLGCSALAIWVCCFSTTYVPVIHWHSETLFTSM